MNHKKIFYRYVIPSILSFALSGVYAIVDGFFVGNSIGDIGLSAINIAYPIVAVLQSVGTGIGMGGAVKYSIYMAEEKKQEAKKYIGVALWLMILSSILLTISIYMMSNSILSLLGATGKLLSLGNEYIKIIALGTLLHVFGTGLVPFMRNFGGSFWSMIAMVSGFATNILLDYVFVWTLNLGVFGAALATVIGQGVTMTIALIYCALKKNLTLKIDGSKLWNISSQIFKIGLAPFGLTLVPNISLVIINKFSMIYGGEEAVAVYACIAYIICVIYLILQGVGDGSQPLMSQFYGRSDEKGLKEIQKLANQFAMFLSIVGMIILFLYRSKIGLLFGTSQEVNLGIQKIMPIFLVSVPFVSITRISTASFYATEKSMLSYILTFIEPILMLILMLILPPLLGGQIMIWWSSVFARILTAILAILLTQKSHTK